MIIVLLIISAIIIAFYFLKLHYQYWEKLGVPGPKPKFLIGNFGQSFLLKQSIGEVFTDIYNKYQDVPMVGVYRASTPSLIIRVPELIKEITVTSFESFRDNDLPVDKKVDPFFGRNPFALTNEQWKIVRRQLTPGFTSGKMKWLYPHLEDVGKGLVKFIETQPKTMNGEGYEAKELCLRFTLNAVAISAFGIEGKCFDEKNSEFREIASNFITPGDWTSFKIFVVYLIPIVAKFVSVKFIVKYIEDKLTNIVTQTLKYREENNIVRNDYLHMMNQLKKTCKEYEFTDIDIAAHATGFLFDGYETSSIVMSFLLYELAANPEVQSKLREEINQNTQENGKLPYDVIQGMAYLDGVVNESMRMHPAVFALYKLSTKPYTFHPYEDTTKSIDIEAGTPIVLPVYGLQNDPKYFEDPKCFKPERFIGDNKKNINKYTFLPFGEGPRTCLGQRFGILQIKIGIAHIIKNFELSVNNKTKVPLKYISVHFLPYPVGGLWIDFKKIT